MATRYALMAMLVSCFFVMILLQIHLVILLLMEMAKLCNPLMVGLTEILIQAQMALLLLLPTGHLAGLTR